MGPSWTWLCFHGEAITQVGRRASASTLGLSTEEGPSDPPQREHSAREPEGVWASELTRLSQAFEGNALGPEK